MKKFAICIAAALVMLTSPIAAQTTVNVSSVSLAAPKPPLTVADALTMLAAHRALDGHQVAVKQPGGESIMIVPWEFGSGTLRLRLAKNITALAAVEKAADEARIGIVKEITKGIPGGEIKAGSPEFDKFQQQYLDVLKQPAQVTLSRITAAELKLDKNEIPGTVLSGLSSILDE